MSEDTLKLAHAFLTRRGRVNFGLDAPPPPPSKGVPEEAPAGPPPPPPTLKQIKKALYGILRTVDFAVRESCQDATRGGGPEGRATLIDEWHVAAL